MSTTTPTFDRLRPTRYLQIDDMAHDLTINGKFYEELIPAIVNWMKEQLGTSKADSAPRPN